MSTYRPEFDSTYFNGRSVGFLPGLLGIRIVEIGQGRVVATLEVRKELHAPNGFLHAGTVVTLADTACGYGCVAHLPPGAKGFTTIELKSNHLGTALDGVIQADATAVHLGRSTQVWDATVKHQGSGKTIALFRCTQMVL
jgi:1,4-dihydroxy-2-naphthoyl-CoA hydrolase